MLLFITLDVTKIRLILQQSILPLVQKSYDFSVETVIQIIAVKFIPETGVKAIPLLELKLTLSNSVVGFSFFSIRRK